MPTYVICMYEDWLDITRLGTDGAALLITILVYLRQVT